LAAEAAVGSVEVVVVLPLLKLVVEHLGVVDDFAVEETVELFGVDAVGSLHLAVEPGGSRFDVAVPDAFVGSTRSSVVDGLGFVRWRECAM
jgi:hypothetical protein